MRQRRGSDSIGSNDVGTTATTGSLKPATVAACWPFFGLLCACDDDRCCRECGRTATPPTTDYYYHHYYARPVRRRRRVDVFAGVSARAVGAVILPPGCASLLEAHRGVDSEELER